MLEYIKFFKESVVDFVFKDKKIIGCVLNIGFCH